MLWGKGLDVESEDSPYMFCQIQVPDDTHLWGL